MLGMAQSISNMDTFTYRTVVTGQSSSPTAMEKVFVLDEFVYCISTVNVSYTTIPRGDDAINTGTPLSSLGPGDVCPDLDDCASTVGTISDLDDLATGDVRLLTMTAKGRVSGEVCPARVNVTEPALA